MGDAETLCGHFSLPREIQHSCHAANQCRLRTRDAEKPRSRITKPKVTRVRFPIISSSLVERLRLGVQGTALGSLSAHGLKAFQPQLLARSLACLDPLLKGATSVLLLGALRLLFRNNFAALVLPEAVLLQAPRSLFLLQSKKAQQHKGNYCMSLPVPSPQTGPKTIVFFSAASLGAWTNSRIQEAGNIRITKHRF